MRILLLIIVVSSYVFGGMAPNQTQCADCQTPTPPPKRVPTVICDTPTPSPTVEPTETPGPWACPAIGDLSKKEYREMCVELCDATGQHGCAGICNKCYGGE